MGWLQVAEEAQVRAAGQLAIEVEGERVALFVLDGEIYAIGNVCTHQFALLTDGYVEDGCVECPLHQGLFDIRTGKAMGPPVTEDLRTFAVKLEGGAVFVDLERPAEIAAPSDRSGPAASAEGPAEDLAVADPLDGAPLVVVGAGQAGARAAEAARLAGFTGRILLIGDEPELPYERPPLSKTFLTEGVAVEAAQVLSAARLAELSIELMTGRRVEAIDRAARTLRLDGGETCGYGRLILATGARARRLALPGVELPGVYALRSLDDSRRLAAALRRARRLVVVGGGFIGLEVASSARALGLEVTLLERAPALMSRLLPAEAAEAVAARARAGGVALETGVEVAGLAAGADGAVEAVRLADGRRLAADLVVVGVGAAPNLELAEAAGLAVDGSVTVDAYGATSDPDIFAAGDVAGYPHAGKAAPLRLESWRNAQDQGVAAGRSAVGRPSRYETTPWFWSDQFGGTIQIYGLPAPDQNLVRRAAARPQAESFFCLDAEGRVAAVVSFDDPEGARQGRALLEAGERLDPATPAAGGAAVAARRRKESDTPMTDIPPKSAQKSLQERYRWPEDESRIPDWVYTDETIYAREVERIFHGRTWNYVALEAEIPEAGDFVRSNVGPTPVVVARGADGAVNVFENRCAHRAAEFCRAARGNAKEFVCPYHQWSYDLAGNLTGVPFRRGVAGKGGMPKDFKPEAHGVRKLAVARRGGVVFASYAEDMPDLADYMGPEIVRDFDAVFHGKPLKILGYYRNTLPGNWKLYHENLKDPYHATLLHTFLVTFGLLVAGNKSQMICDATGRHGTMASAKSDGTKVDAEARKEMRAYREGMGLNDARFMDYVEEFDSPWSVTMQTIWPNLVVQREMNTLGVRQIVPNGPNEFVMNWTMFGYADDDAEMTRHRLRQGNLMGPAGFLGLEDNEAIKFVQDGMLRGRPGEHLVALDPDTPAGTSDTLISEAAIRGLYRYWRRELGL